MDPPLGEKVAFFRQLRRLQGDDDDDEMDESEIAHRMRCKAFYGPRPATPKISSNAPVEATARAAGPRRTASAPVPMPPSGSAAAVIQRTPMISTEVVRREVIELDQDEVDTVQETPILDSLAPEVRRRSTHPLQRNNPQQSPSVRNTSSKPPLKRKRGSSINTVPEADQLFKGLSFHYIPNDDVNKVRKARITKAREHGATWVRKLSEATHVIVDKHLQFSQIESILKQDPNIADKILVNEEYPLDCIHYRKLIPSAQTQYQVTGMPSAKAEATPVTPKPSSSSDTSLKIKARQENRSRWDYVPPPGTPQRSSDSSQPQSKPASQTNEQPRGDAGAMYQLVSRDSDPADERQGSEEQGQATVPKDNTPAASSAPEATKSMQDDLSHIIEVVREYRDVALNDDDEDEKSELALQAEDRDTDSVGSEDERTRKTRSARKKKQPPPARGALEDRFACMKGGTEASESELHNAKAIQHIQRLQDFHERVGNQWRAFSYRKAVATLRRVDKQLTTAEDAIGYSNIGQSIARKIEEIARTDHLQGLESTEKEHEALQTFMQIYDVGHVQASKWIAQGFQTLVDLKQKAKLTPNQRVGVEHFDDLNTRIPRREVEALGSEVKKHAATIDPLVELIIGGSYRRGSDSSGDIDFIVTKPGTSSTEELAPFLNKLIERLRETGFLTAVLASLHHSAKKGQGSIWHGCCVLPREAFPGESSEYKPIWRRVDFLLVPETEIGAALIYFTGNDIFNRSIRQLASAKQMRLNQRGLYRDATRGQSREKVADEELIEGRDEKEIFRILGVKWREPHERWC